MDGEAAIPFPLNDLTIIETAEPCGQRGAVGISKVAGGAGFGLLAEKNG
jgi:hypothetical protein